MSYLGKPFSSIKLNINNDVRMCIFWKENQILNYNTWPSSFTLYLIQKVSDCVGEELWKDYNKARVKKTVFLFK
jgi:hypothetical protein